MKYLSVYTTVPARNVLEMVRTLPQILQANMAAYAFFAF